MATDDDAAGVAAETAVADLVRAAGIVVLRPAADAPDSLEVLAVHRPRYDDWSLPKGKLEAGELPLVAAVREVWEETRVRAVPGRSLPGTRYLDRDGRPKTVDWWLGAVALQEPRAADEEVDELRWLATATAGTVLTHSMDTDLLAGVAGLLDRGSDTDTSALLDPPVILLRHASARSRKSWGGPELERPLDDDGFAQAGTLVDLLRALRPARVVSSTARRCRQTVEPFAAAVGLEVEEEPDLTEQAFDDDGDRPLAVLSRVVADRGRGPWLLCTHRPVLGPLLSAATGRSWARGREKALRTAEVAVLTGAWGRMSAERHATAPG